MKNWIKKIGQNKFQFFFLVGMFALLLGSIVLASTLGSNEKPIEKPSPDTSDKLPSTDNTDNVDTKPEEVFKLPFSDNMDYQVVRKFYEKDASIEEQTLSLIKYNNTYRTSNGTSYAKKDGSSFDVLCSLSGEVTEIKDSPLYGKYVVVKSSDTISTFYYGLSEVTVTVGASVTQGSKLGISGKTEIDSEAGNHVFVRVAKSNVYVNPEKLIGKKISDI